MNSKIEASSNNRNQYSLNDTLRTKNISLDNEDISLNKLPTADPLIKNKRQKDFLRSSIAFNPKKPHKPKFIYTNTSQPLTKSKKYSEQPNLIKDLKITYSNKTTPLKMIPRFYKGVNTSVACTLTSGNFVAKSEIKRIIIDSDAISNNKHNENQNVQYYHKKFNDKKSKPCLLQTKESAKTYYLYKNQKFMAKGNSMAENIGTNSSISVSTTKNFINKKRRKNMVGQNSIDENKSLNIDCIPWKSDPEVRGLRAVKSSREDHSNLNVTDTCINIPDIDQSVLTKKTKKLINEANSIANSPKKKPLLQNYNLMGTTKNQNSFIVQNSKKSRQCSTSRDVSAGNTNRDHKEVVHWAEDSKPTDNELENDLNEYNPEINQKVSNNPELSVSNFNEKQKGQSFSIKNFYKKKISNNSYGNDYRKFDETSKMAPKKTLTDFSIEGEKFGDHHEKGKIGCSFKQIFNKNQKKNTQGHTKTQTISYNESEAYPSNNLSSSNRHYTRKDCPRSVDYNKKRPQSHYSNIQRQTTQGSSKEDVKVVLENRVKYNNLSAGEGYKQNFEIRRFPKQTKLKNFQKLGYNQFYDQCRYSIMDMRHSYCKEFEFEQYCQLETLVQQVIMGNSLKLDIKLKPIFGLRLFNEALKKSKEQKSAEPLISFLKNNKESFFEYFS